VQDFPKKSTEKNSHKNIEMIQEGPVHTDRGNVVHTDNIPTDTATANTGAATAGAKADTKKPAVELTITQDFAQKPATSFFSRSFKKLALMQTKIGEASTFIENIFGVNN